MSPRPIDAAILAAGRGRRLGARLPKQFLPLCDTTILARTLDVFLGAAEVRRVIVVVGAGDEAAFAAAVGARAARVEVVTGGATRQASVAAALAALDDDPPQAVLVHDGARPFVSPGLLARVVAALDDADAVIPALAVADTLKRVDGDLVSATAPREHLVQAQTPQGFRFRPFRAAHRDMTTAATDDAAVMEAAGHRVRVIAGERVNFKITTADDLAAAETLAGAMRDAVLPVVGQGFDVHRLAAGGPLVLGGLEIDAPVHLVGHSDADVALHALTDALLGAVAAGDIGQHFPPSDPAWKGAPSAVFLAHAAERVCQVGEIAHLDLTLICERPRIGPVREAMRERIAAIVGVPTERVAVKATTTEGLGFTGREEGIAAQAVATVLRRVGR